MNNKITNVLAFVVGTGIGSVATWQIVKTKYQKLADEEIKSVKEVFEKKSIALTNEVEKAHKYAKVSATPEKEYEEVVEDLGYSQAKEKKGKKVKNKKINVISPDAFGELDYTTESLTYYADKVLADDRDNVIENVDALVGKQSLNCFGEYEDDSVFVRNDELKIDFEILLDTRNYSDVVGAVESFVSKNE